jgi:hypothetical protein
MEYKLNEFITGLIKEYFSYNNNIRRPISGNSNISIDSVGNKVIIYNDNLDIIDMFSNIIKYHNRSNEAASRYYKLSSILKSDIPNFLSINDIITDDIKKRVLILYNSVYTGTDQFIEQEIPGELYYIIVSQLDDVSSVENFINTSNSFRSILSDNKSWLNLIREKYPKYVNKIMKSRGGYLWKNIYLGLVLLDKNNGGIIGNLRASDNSYHKYTTHLLRYILLESIDTGSLSTEIYNNNVDLIFRSFLKWKLYDIAENILYTENLNNKKINYNNEDVYTNSVIYNLFIKYQPETIIERIIDYPSENLTIQFLTQILKEKTFTESNKDKLIIRQGFRYSYAEIMRLVSLYRRSMDSKFIEDILYNFILQDKNNIYYMKRMFKDYPELITLPLLLNLYKKLVLEVKRSTLDVMTSMTITKYIFYHPIMLSYYNEEINELSEY